MNQNTFLNQLLHKDHKDINYINDFYNKFNVDGYLKLLKNKSEEFWLRQGEKMALNLFHLVAKNVPAYGDFLKRHNIKVNSIKNIEDFKKLPTINKNNYLNKYSLDKLSYGGKLMNNDIVSVSSGTSGVPFLWPRGSFQEYEVNFVHEAFLKDIFEIDKKDTLFVVGYGIGMYVAGMCTSGCIWRISQKGYPLINVMPGLNKEDIIKTILSLGSKVDQVILAAYPPIAKDVIDSGIKKGINWKKYNMKFIFGGESFSEEWRDYMTKKAGVTDIYSGFMNTYGTADATVVGHETPITILLRRIVGTREKLSDKLYGETFRQPGLYQYNPLLRYLEVENGRILITAFSGIPLIRYDIGDGGGLLKYDDIDEKLRSEGIIFKKEIKKAGLNNELWNLPFVYISGRPDMTVTLYGVNIYPESIKDILTDKSKSEVTGRFAMFTKYTKEHDQFLEINIELSAGKSASDKIRNKYQKLILEYLLKNYVEYSKLHDAIKEKALPKVILWSNNHQKYFNSLNRMGKSLVLKSKKDNK